MSDGSSSACKLVLTMYPISTLLNLPGVRFSGISCAPPFTSFSLVGSQHCVPQAHKLALHISHSIHQKPLHVRVEAAICAWEAWAGHGSGFGRVEAGFGESLDPLQGWLFLELRQLKCQSGGASSDKREYRYRLRSV